MMKHMSTLAFSLCLALGVAAPATAQMQSDGPMQERMYGYELMTPQERTEYQARMRALNTEQEREAFRLEHHKKMQERAKAQGKTLPDAPPGMGPGMMGPGGGKGMGPGGGRGPGY
jgi:hypothetical protein